WGTAFARNSPAKKEAMYSYKFTVVLPSVVASESHGKGQVAVEWRLSELIGIENTSRPTAAALRA
ncbi:MAG TPA: hypothetical protein VM912_15480, partial [Terriglobales bacterium]|nr:hypothetical protein [Terriglobales bacterium]